MSACTKMKYKVHFDAVSRLVPSIKVAYIDRSTIDEKINSEMSFERTVRVPGITKAHMIHCTSHSAKLWRNCGYQLDQLDITVQFSPRASASLAPKTSQQ